MVEAEKVATHPKLEENKYVWKRYLSNLHVKMRLPSMTWLISWSWLMIEWLIDSSVWILIDQLWNLQFIDRLLQILTSLCFLVWNNPRFLASIWLLRAQKLPQLIHLQAAWKSALHSSNCSPLFIFFSLFLVENRPPLPHLLNLTLTWNRFLNHREAVPGKFGP